MAGNPRQQETPERGKQCQQRPEFVRPACGLVHPSGSGTQVLKFSLDGETIQPALRHERLLLQGQYS